MFTIKKDESRLLYADKAQYQELSTGDQLFFDWLFYQLIYSTNFDTTNKEIAKAYCMSESTLEKRLNRIDACGLIKREVTPYKLGNKWNNFRVIRLNKLLFPEFASDSVEERLNIARDMIMSKHAEIGDVK